LTAPAPKARAWAGISAKKFQGVLNSAKRIPAESRRFEPMETRKLKGTPFFRHPFYSDIVAEFDGAKQIQPVTF